MCSHSVQTGAHLTGWPGQKGCSLGSLSSRSSVLSMPIISHPRYHPSPPLHRLCHRGWRMLTDLSNLLLSSLVVYGLPLIFGIVLVASLGVPLPATLVLLTAGALVQQQLLSMTWVLVACLLATVGGDHLGYWLGWWGGRPLI